MLVGSSHNSSFFDSFVRRLNETFSSPLYLWSKQYSPPFPDKELDDRVFEVETCRLHLADVLSSLLSFTINLSKLAAKLLSSAFVSSRDWEHFCH